MTPIRTAVYCAIALILGASCAHTHARRAHSEFEASDLLARTTADPPDFSRDSNVAIVAAGGRSYENSIAVSRVDPDTMVMATIDVTSGYRVTTYSSFDGGVTWSQPQPTALTASNGKSYAGSADPLLVADSDGSFYLAMIVEGTLPPANTEGNAVAVSRSTDGGLTWSTPVVVVDHPFDAAPQQADDKEWLDIDPVTGRLHVAFAYFEISGRRILNDPILYTAWSDDHGVTWSAPQKVTQADLQYSQLATAPTGEVYLSYANFPAAAYVVRKSTDGGSTFGPEVTALPDPDIEGWRMANTNTNITPAHSFAVDRSDGPYRGTLYAAALSKGGVLVAHSSDGGTTWSRPLLMGGTDVCFVAVTVDPSTGHAIVSWLDRIDDPANVSARLYASQSTNGGESFSSPRAFSSPFDLAARMADYDTADAAGVCVRAFTTGAGFASVARIEFPSIGPRRRTTTH